MPNPWFKETSQVGFTIDGKRGDVIHMEERVYRTFRPNKIITKDVAGGGESIVRQIWVDGQSVSEPFAAKVFQHGSIHDVYLARVNGEVREGQTIALEVELAGDGKFRCVLLGPVDWRKAMVEAATEETEEEETP